MATWSGGYGDALDVTELLARKERLLQIIVSERAPDPTTRDDVLQEARIIIWKLADKPRRDDGYLHGAVRHRVDDVRDRQTWTGHTGTRGHTDVAKMVTTERLDAGLVLTAAAVLDNIDMAYHHGEVLDAIAALEPNQRAYVIMRFWGGLSNPEIAASTGRSLATVSRWWSEAKPTLRAALGHLAGV
jgi:RNA polymerase sigma factor (sigma-70 family)